MYLCEWLKDAPVSRKFTNNRRCWSAFIHKLADLETDIELSYQPLHTRSALLCFIADLEKKNNGVCVLLQYFELETISSSHVASLNQQVSGAPVMLSLSQLREVI